MTQQEAYASFGDGIFAPGGGMCCNFAFQFDDAIADPNGTFHTPNREYVASQGRWLTPDPAGLAVMDVTNPQSWNRYAYVTNNPISFTDPLGLDSESSSTDSSGNTTDYTSVDVTDTFDIGPAPTMVSAANSIGRFEVPGDTVNVTDTMPPGPQAASAAPCSTVPKNPKASATANLNLVNQSTKGMWPATKLLYFDYVFKTGGAFDYKTNYGGAGWGPDPNQFVDYGNWNFGYSCGANYPSLFCQSAAGVNRMWRAATRGQNPFGSGLPFLKKPFGDQAQDNRQIVNGIQAQASGCVQ